jgi:putative aldouronate transport system substrate-binding protein
MTVFFLALALADCARGEKNPVPGGEGTVINMYLFSTGDSFRNIEPVLAAFEARTKETLNIGLRLHIMSVEDYRNQMPLILDSGAEADLVFDAPWMHLAPLMQKDAYKELSASFESPGLEGLRAAFPRDFLDANRFYGGLYGIPIMDVPYDIPGVFYRKDLARKYGIAIETYADLRAFFDAVHSHEAGVIPLAIGNTRGFYHMFDSPREMARDRLYEIEGIIGGGRELLYVGLSPDGKQVTGVSAYGDPLASYAAYMPPRRTFAGFNRYFFEASRWSAYTEPDTVLRETAKPLFLGGYAASEEGTISEFEAERQRLEEAVPGAELGFWPYNEDIRNRRKGVVALSFRAWNYLCVPRRSAKTEKVFQFLDWVFASKENNDLFALGLPDQQDYRFPGFQLTWNPRFVRIPEGLPQDIQDLLAFQAAPDSFTRTPLAGFIFDERPVTLEVAKIRVIWEKYHYALLCGAYDDPSAALRAMNAEMEDAGLAAVKAEIARQVRAWVE